MTHAIDENWNGADVRTMKPTIFEIKRKGRLLAIDRKWQYWMYYGAIYQVNVNGIQYSKWCEAGRFAEKHRQESEAIGAKFFSNRDGMLIVNKTLIPKQTEI